MQLKEKERGVFVCEKASEIGSRTFVCGCCRRFFIFLLSFRFTNVGKVCVFVVRALFLSFFRSLSLLIYIFICFYWTGKKGGFIDL